VILFFADIPFILLMSTPVRRLVVVGAGPAGLTAAFEAQRNGFEVTVLEKDPVYVGGISRTVRHQGNRFDIGGHRFFSKSNEIMRWWKARLPDDFIQVRRLSRIYYHGKFFDYPLKPWNALGNLGLFTSAACVLSYVWAQFPPRKPDRSFEDWVSNRFGRRLFNIFFKTYTEKVWGLPCSQISADWAAQRIRGLSLYKAILNAFRGAPQAPGSAVIKTLIDTFDYPRLGPGQMWEKVAADFQAAGGQLHLGMQAVKLAQHDHRVIAVEAVPAGGARRRFEADHFIVSMPLQETVQALDPALSPAAVAAARKLVYRDFLTVALIIEDAPLFPDNWIYIHEPTVKLGRIQNFRNWSAAMVARPGITCLGLEYFCFAGDDLWTTPDQDLIELGKRELAQLGLARPEKVKDGIVVRMEKAYPVYDPGYQENVQSIRAELARLANLQVVGRYGMHKYNNQDHSMMTAILAVKNLQGGHYNLWNVNTDAEYQEEVHGIDASGGRLMPQSLRND
jgi:protoporphyrinogen oxidase